MKKKVTNINKNINKMSTRNKIIALLTALSLSMSIGSITASAKNVKNVEIPAETATMISNANIDNVIDSLYQKQMDYLIPTIEKLKAFYINEDVKDIIKNGYPEAYEITKMNFNYDTVSTAEGVDYVSKSTDKLEDIINNNVFISELKIRPEGNGRDPEYGIINDKNSTNGLGFRGKTEEDKKLIDRYTNILGDRILIDSHLVNLISGIKNGEYSEELLLNALESTYNKQMNYIYDTSIKLKNFYSLVDNNDIIKNGYKNAYNAINKDMNAYPISYGTKEHSFINKDMFNNNDMSTDEKINKFIDLIKDNEITISSLKIKAKGNGRDPEYGIITDKNSTNGMGFRTKTEEDKKLIDKYTELLGTYDYIPMEVINLLTNTNVYIKNNNKTIK